MAVWVCIMGFDSTLSAAIATLVALQTGVSTDAGTRAFVARVNTVALANDWPFACNSEGVRLWFSRRDAAAVLLLDVRQGTALSNCVANNTHTAAFSPRLIARSGKSVKQALVYRLDMLREMLRPQQQDIARVFAGYEQHGSGSTCAGC